MPSNDEHSRRAAQLEELANSLTHGFGLALSLAGLPILIVSVRHASL